MQIILCIKIVVRAYACTRAPWLALRLIHAWTELQASMDGAQSKHGWVTGQAWTPWYPQSSSGIQRCLERSTKL